VDLTLRVGARREGVGLNAESCVGLFATDRGAESFRQHAWVPFRLGESVFLFEPAARIRSRMIRELADALARYEPHFSVNHRFETRAFAGCMSDVRSSPPAGNDPVAAV